MAGTRISTGMLRVLRRPPDLERLPHTLQIENGRGQGLLLMLFACLWGGLPAYVLLTQEQQQEAGVTVMLLFPLVGLGLFAYGVLSLFRRRQATIDRLGVHGETRSLFGVQSWSAPLSSYRGVLLKTVYIRRRKSSVTAHAVFLAHVKAEKTVPLYVDRNREATRRQWERAASQLRLPALEETEAGEVARDPEDLDKSVRELAAEGKLDIDFQARPPPPALSASYDGEVLVVSTTRPTVSGRLALVLLAAPLLAIVLAAAFSAGGFIVFAVIVGLVLAAFLFHDRYVRERLCIGRDGVARQWFASFGRGPRRRVEAAAIEAVRVVRPRRKRPRLLIVGDQATLRFGAGQPREALEWAREAVLAHVAGQPAAPPPLDSPAGQRA